MNEMFTAVITELQVLTEGEIGVITLIILLALRVVFEVEEEPWARRLVSTAGIACIPLLFAFAVIVLHRIAGYLY